MTPNNPRFTEPRILPSLGLFGLAMLPGLVALLPGLMVPLWNFYDPEQQIYLTTLRVLWLAIVMVAACLPFVAAAVIPAVLRSRGRSAASSLRAAAPVCALLGCIAALCVMVATGGF